MDRRRHRVFRDRRYSDGFKSSARIDLSQKVLFVWHSMRQTSVRDESPSPHDRVRSRRRAADVLDVLRASRVLSMIDAKHRL